MQRTRINAALDFAPHQVIVTACVEARRRCLSSPRFMNAVARIRAIPPWVRPRLDPQAYGRRGLPPAPGA
jgi:hypothetical protein